MRALSLTQPWATLMALRHKTVETRSWPTTYRGELVIHAAKGFPGWAKEMAEEWGELLGCEPSGLPRGVLLCVVRLVAVHRTEQYAPPLLEREFGDYEAGRAAWVTEYVRPLEHVPCRGSLGLWDVPPEVMAAAELPNCSPEIARPAPPQRETSAESPLLGPQSEEPR